MDNAQKAIMVGVSVFIVIGLITAVILITNIGTDAMSSSNKQLEGVSSSVSAQIMSNYDTVQMDGKNVISSIKKFYEKDNFVLGVIDESDVTTYFATKKVNIGDIGPSQDGSNIETFSETNKYKYMGYILKNSSLVNNSPNISNLTSIIKSTDKYMAYVLYECETDNVLGIMFKKI